MKRRGDILKMGIAIMAISLIVIGMVLTTEYGLDREPDSTGHPVLKACFLLSNTTVRTDEVVTFDASKSQGNFFSFSWEFGDDTTETGEKVHHTYHSPGYYSITLRAYPEEKGIDPFVVEKNISVELVYSDSGRLRGGETHVFSSTVKSIANESNMTVTISIPSDPRSSADGRARILGPEDSEVSHDFHLDIVNGYATTFTLDLPEPGVGDYSFRIEVYHGTTVTVEFDCTIVIMY